MFVDHATVESDGSLLAASGQWGNWTVAEIDPAGGVRAEWTLGVDARSVTGIQRQADGRILVDALLPRFWSSEPTHWVIEHDGRVSRVDGLHEMSRIDSPEPLDWFRAGPYWPTPASGDGGSAHAMWRALASRATRSSGW